MNEFLPVSIVTPAYNAADTIAETIGSVLAQTMPQWALIVVDDGSTDETAVITQQYAQADGRIRLIQQENRGGSAARNVGIAQAKHEWLLFLDADDWLLPAHLAQMTAMLRQDDVLDAVHCGWQRVAPDGSRGEPQFGPVDTDLFPVFAERCAFQTNTCMVRRDRVTAVSGFDESLKSCQDWDFWQRLARSGVRFGALPEVLALYRTRPGSISLHGAQQLQDSLRVISQAHAPDERFVQTAYAAGLPAEQAAQARVRFACWSFGLILGQGKDARPYLQLLGDDRDLELDPDYVAACVFEAAVLPRGLGDDGWDLLWPEIGEQVVAFLVGLEAQTYAPELAHSTQRELEQLIMKHSHRERPFAIGGTWAMAVQVEEPLPVLEPPPGTAVCRVEVWLGEKYLGAVNVETPQQTASQQMASQQVARAIAEEFAWTILGEYAERHLLPQLQLVVGTTGVSVWRDDVHLVTLPPTKPEALWEMAWNEVGWVLFLQEIWDRPTWPNSYFYDVALLEPGKRTEMQVETAVTLNLSDLWPDLLVPGKAVTATLAVAGEAVASCTLPATDGRIAAHALRANLTQAAGFDLCGAVVQYALLERPLADPTSLRQRLQEKCGGTGR